ncbi:actinorhodin polyketide dimerase ActVA [Actinocorallia aurea]
MTTTATEHISGTGGAPAPSAQDPSGLPAAARLLRPLAAAHAAETEAALRVAAPVVRGLREAGFARHFVAPRWGGADGTFGEFVRGVFAVSEGCASAGWCAALLGASSRFAAHLPEEGHEELWGSGPDTAIVTGLVPSGTAEPVEGGYLLSGDWAYLSGVDFADWALLCASVPGDPAPELRFFAVPAGSYRTVRTWDCAGMRGTGSHTVELREVHVPRHRTFARSDFERGANAWSAQPSHNVPYQAAGALMLAAPAVGAALGALRATGETLRGKRLTEPAQVDLGRAAGRIDAARLLVEQIAGVVDARDFAPGLLARNQRDAASAAELAAEGVAVLVRVAGTSGLSEAGDLQRFWRDVTAATTHVALRWDITRAAVNYAASLVAADAA